MQSPRREIAEAASQAVIAGLLPPEHIRATASVFQSVAAMEHAFASLSGNEAKICHSRSSGLGTCVSGGVALLVAGAVRVRGEQAWIPLHDSERLNALATVWKTGSSSVLERLRGHFLLIAVDENRGETVVAVDRMGALPLCYGLTRSRQLVIATTATLASSHPLSNARLSPQALYNYVHFHMVPSPGTVFEGISKLEPAQFLRYRGGRIELGRYWEPGFTSRPEESFEELRERFLGTLEKSVQRCVDDPSAVDGMATGTFLSGGIDSSTVTGMLARVCGTPAPAYSMGFEADGYDEARYAQIASQHFRAPLRQFYVTPRDIQTELMTVAGTFDEPFGNSSAIPTLLCARRAKSEGVSRLLAGDGGDELFGGNTRYAKQKIFEVYHRLPAWSRTHALEPLLLGSRLPARIPLVSKVASYVEQARMPMPDRTDSYNFLVRTPLESIFEPGFLGAIDSRQPFELLRRRYAAAPSRELVDRMLYLDWKFTLADNDLRKVGRMCALAGIEVRYPWLDDDVIELSTTLPPHWKVRGQTLRYFAKRALTGFLPEAILRKSKHGFGLPFGEWLKTSPELQGQVYSLLEALKGRSIVRGQFIDELIQHHRAGHASYFGTMVWVFAMLEAWLQAHRYEL